MFGNYAAQAGVIAGKNFVSVNIEWNFNNVLVFGFDPFPSNINDSPRINTWRSDGANLNYMSGGRYVVYPPFSATGTIFEPWGDRNTGSANINIPLTGNTFAGVDAFIPSGISVTFEPPLGVIPIGTIVIDPITGRTFTIGDPIQQAVNIQQAYRRAVSNWLSQNNIGWQKVGTTPGEDQYQYVLNNGKNPTLKIILSGINSPNNIMFWDFVGDPSCKTLTNFSISYTKPNNDSLIIADWNDNSSQTILSSGINYDHTFQPCINTGITVLRATLIIGGCTNDVALSAYHTGNLRSVGTRVYSTSGLNSPLPNGYYGWYDSLILPNPCGALGRTRLLEINNGVLISNPPCCV